MIVELFGPPGVGKTSFARALAARLREHDYVVVPMLSLRPSERSSGYDVGRVAPLLRVTRALIETFATAGHLLVHPQDWATAANLMGMMPAKNVIWSIKSYQYLLRLSRSWRLASATTDIALFDQGFVQAVCSLALHGGTVDGQLMRRALDLTPRPDLLIRLDAPREILAARLAERKRRQNKIEHLLELDLPTNLKAIEVIEQLQSLMQERGSSTMCVSSVDQITLAEAVERAERQIVAKLGASRAARRQGAQDHGDVTLGKPMANRSDEDRGPMARSVWSASQE